MNFIPLYDRLLVQRCAEEKYHGVIEIPDSAKEKPLEGMVLAVGAGRYNDAGNLMPMSVKAGDRILMGKYAGTEIKVDGADLLILREDEVLGIIAVTTVDKTLIDPREWDMCRIEETAPLPFPEKPANPETAENFLDALKKVGEP